MQQALHLSAYGCDFHCFELNLTLPEPSSVHRQDVLRCSLTRVLCERRYYIFASMWGHKVYTIYSILFIVFIILLIVTAFITVALTYFQLAVEDHRWWWRSFLCGGSTGARPPNHVVLCLASG